MSTFRQLRIFSGIGLGRRRKTEKEQLDRFLTDHADPGLIQSLRQEEHRRKVWLFTVIALGLGLLLGGGMVWSLRERLAAGKDQNEITYKSGNPSPEELARLLTANGLALAKAKEIREAWAYLTLATELSPNRVEAWDALAMAHFYGGQMEEAERAFRHCTKIDPGYQRGYHGMGDVYFYTGDYRRAEEYWLKGDALRGVARLRLLEGRFAEAAPLIRDLEQKIPDQWFVRLMVEAVQTGHLTPEMRLHLAPGFVGSRRPETARGWRLYFFRRYNEASAAFTRVLHQDPEDGSALLGRGWCRLKMDSPQEAQADFDRVLQRWPSNYSALNGLGWSLKAQGQTERASASWKRVLELRPESPETPESLKGLGLLSFEQGDYAQASRYLTQSLLQNPQDAETKTYLEDAMKHPDNQGRARSSMLGMVKP